MYKIIKDSKVIGGLSGYSDTNTIMQVFADAGLKKNQIKSSFFVDKYISY